MLKVLVSGVGGDVAQGVIKCLNSSSIEIEIYKIAGDSNESWLYTDNKSFLPPPVKSPRYIDFLINFIKTQKINAFVPCIDSEIFKISLHKERIEEETGCKVIVGDLDKILICEDKLKTFHFLKKNNFCYPRTFTNKDDVEYIFPYILKSRKGSGSRNIVVVNDKDDFEECNFTEEKILQEKLDGEEYTAGIYLGKDSKVKGVCIFRRELKGGTTVFAERIINPSVEAELSEISKKLGLPYVNIQFKMKDGRPCPFEFNGRFSGTTSFISRIFNAPEMWIKEELFNEALEPVNNEELFQVMRFYNEIYATPSQVNSLLKRSE